MQLDRNEKHKRNEKLENLLVEINTILEQSEDKILKNYHMPRYPVVFIVGCARSGSTILLQWLANTGYFAYPTNLLSRFYAAPYIGAKIQQLLTDPQYNFKDELAGICNNIDFSSELGKTQGMLSPNEFWYFWRRFFHYGEIQHLDEEALNEVNTDIFVSEIAALESAFEKPFALKGHIINWNIPFVNILFRKALFIHIVRDPLFNAQSLLEARINYFGNWNRWYSFKPIEFEELKNYDSYQQIAGQVFYTNRAIIDGLAKIDDSRQLKINYETFCSDPMGVFNQIKIKFVEQEYKVDWQYKGPQRFKSTNQLRLPKEVWKKIIEAFKKFSYVGL